MTPAGSSLAGRVALVTGGSRGIGRAIAVGLAEAGAAVGVFARNRDALEEVRSEVASAGGTIDVMAGDVTSSDAVRDAVDSLSHTLGPIDILVNNAAVQTSIGDVSFVDPTAWWSDMRVNVYGPFLFMRYTLPRMIERGQGRIINVASNACWFPFPHVSSYNSSKAALVRCSETVAAEVRQQGIFVFSITPGQVRTDLWETTSATLNEQGAFGDVLGAVDPKFDSPDLPAALVRTLGSGAMDDLTGRFVGVHDDLDVLLDHVRAHPDSDVGRLRIAQPATSARGS
jgi:NAD(P)-dependent dehydrogenase (short-subunit alcohol dehydrogenase family)